MTRQGQGAGQGLLTTWTTPAPYLINAQRAATVRCVYLNYTPVPKLPRQVGPCIAHQQPMGCLMLALSMEQWEL